MKCASCKNKTSTDQCTSKPLKGLILCGKHAKVKNLRLWKDVNSLDDKAILIQKVWRAYSIRHWLKIAGPGVLNRSICHNDEELVTLDEKKSVSPLDYFSFEEGGKVYWFDVRSISESSMLKVEPLNPYTREPLSIETRRRLRQICIKRHRKNLHNMHNISDRRSIDEIILSTWTHVCQIITENGFFDMSPLYFTSLNPTRLIIFNTMIQKDLVAWAAEHGSKLSRRHRYVFWMKRLFGEFSIGVDPKRLIYLTGRVLVTMLNDCSDNYGICFIIMSALHRL
jgi:hypothetical protein